MSHSSNSGGKHTADVIVIGAGVVGAAIAYFAARAGLSVIVIERSTVAGGTSSRCEGNLLVSDKEAGPELELAKYSLKLWHEDLAEHSHLWEFEAKGGIIVAAKDSSAASLKKLTASQRTAGIEVEDIAQDQLADYEPHINPALLAGAYYPQDAQIMPTLAAGHFMRLARERGAQIYTNTTVTGMHKDGERITGVQTTAGGFHAANVVNAAGTWGTQVAELAGVFVPVLPRRGFLLVTEPMPPTIRHKVYAAEYVDNVGSSDAGLQASPVVEGTPAGTILIGSSRERVGFDHEISPQAMALVAQNALALFPSLKDTQVMRSYFGFRPYCPDHLPVIGPDSRAPGLFHACGHEGAGIGLSAGTGAMIVDQILGRPTAVDDAPFRADRFEGMTMEELDRD